MAALTALKFSNPEGAGQMLEKIKHLQKMEWIKLQDAAIVTWPVGKSKPKTKQLVDMAGKGALQGVFWGILFGLIFVVPFFGIAVGATIGAMGGKMADYGIDNNFIKLSREKVTEGTSALFLLTSDAVPDKVIAELRGFNFDLFASNMTTEQEEQLMAAFVEE